MIYLELFWSYFQIGLFSIGGGYAAMPLIEQQVVKLHPWLTPVQFADIVTIAEMTPGPIAINSATFVGTMVAGVPGAIVATLGCIVPSCMIVMTLAYLYYRFRGLSIIQGVLAGLRPAVIAMIASAGINLFLTAVYGKSGVPDDIWNFQPLALLSLSCADGKSTRLKSWQVQVLLALSYFPYSDMEVVKCNTL